MKKSKNYFHIVPGYNFRMTNIQAAIGYAQLEKVKDICEMLESSNGYIQITSMPKKDA